jgi:hypothetical protein
VNALLVHAIRNRLHECLIAEVLFTPTRITQAPDYIERCFGLDQQPIFCTVSHGCSLLRQLRLLLRFLSMFRPDRIGDSYGAQAAKCADIGLDKHPGTLLELFQDSSNIQAGRQPDTIANALPR